MDYVWNLIMCQDLALLVMNCDVLEACVDMVCNMWCVESLNSVM